MNNTAALADRYAQLKAQSEIIDKELSALRREILATGMELIEGNNCFVKVGLYEQERIDSKAARTKLDAETLRSIMVTSLCERLTVKAKV